MCFTNEKVVTQIRKDSSLENSDSAITDGRIAHCHIAQNPVVHLQSLLLHGKAVRMGLELMAEHEGEHVVETLARHVALCPSEHGQLHDMREASVVAFVNFVVPKDVCYVARAEEPQIVIGSSDEREDFVLRHGVVLQVGAQEVGGVAVDKKEINVRPCESVMDELMTRVDSEELHRRRERVAGVETKVGLQLLDCPLQPR